MTKILKTLLPITAVLVLSTAACAQDAALGADPAATQDLKPSQNQVVRYSAGDSIPLGYSGQARNMPVPTRVVRYSAGSSIPLGNAQPVPVSASVEAPTAAQAFISQQQGLILQREPSVGTAQGFTVQAR